MKRLLFTVLICLEVVLVMAQTTVRGKVTDGESGEPLPYVTVVFANSKIGTTSGFDGDFELTGVTDADSISVEYIGYKTASVAIIKGKVNVLQVALYPNSDVLDEIVVKPGVNPAIAIIEAAQEKRREYNINKVEYYQYESYNKIQLAVDNITESFKKRKLFKEIESLFDTIGALSPDSTVPVLPVFVSETLSDFYYRKSPRRTREVIKATKVKGVGVGKDTYVSQVLGSTFQQYNFYDNNLYILDKDFVSPISTLAHTYYSYQLVDSMYLGKDRCYQIMVFPKNKQDLVFKGMIWITDSTFALKRLNLEITDQANINYVEKLRIQQELTEVGPGNWIPSKLRVLIDISEVTDNTLGFVGSYYNSNRNIEVNRRKDLAFYEEKVHVMENAEDYDGIFWDSSRHERVTASDIKIYKLVDSLRNQPIIKSWVDAVEIIVEGFVPAGKIEFGPYYYLIGYNNLEGFRTRVGFRTREDLSKDFVLKLHGAYGFKDQRFKYIASYEHILSRKKWTKVGLYSKSDVELIGLTDKDYGTSAMYDAFALLGINNINRAVEYKIWGEHELFKGYTQRLILNKRDIEFEPLGNFNFHYITGYNGDGTPRVSSKFNLTTIALEGRLSHKELLIIRKHQRVSLGNLKAPVVKLAYEKGFDGLLDGDFNYQKVNVHVWQFNSLANLGTFEYNVRIGKTFGTVPYPILEIMRGNQGIFSTKATYNLMNFYEFVADQYVALHCEHQFNGLVMNRIPVVNKWKWRLWLSGKAVYGTLSNANRDLIPLIDDEGLAVSPIGSFSRNKPYVELSYGIENIFRLVRIDFIHRLNYLDNPNVSAFGVKGNLVFRF